ncbi:hypothetical protein [Halosimplex pelagicum]|uniref:Sulfatase-like hydrolase/transferase n=1 Tax=Halosimplex pelagicum TaxID=869886 RepID=A0A7D5P596_9EURY|nr:hypothetical protein [Halosimplex pelagicum]QLH81217.1 hypothetical protein HZS54_05985 [Halosimplex pelagicum]
MYSLDQLKRGFASPNLFFREANRLYHRRLNTRTHNISGIDVFSEDWDNLLLLDACRYDMFAEQSDLRGQLESRISRGSSTAEFLKGNIRDRELHDTVYITANPQFYRLQDQLGASFHAVENVWMREGWDEDYNTVLPETMTAAAFDAAEQYPDKRLFIHYIQPHYPFIVDNSELFDNEQAFLKPDEAGSWHQLMTGELTASRNDVWRAYRDNLSRTLPHVNELLDGLEGKSVVSSDHGNMVGERAYPFPIREWGHPRGIYTEQLVKIPWLVIQGERREIVSQPPLDEHEETDDDIVADRLEQLGYV